MDDKKYITTEAECYSNIDKSDNVCEYCGRQLIPIETVDNANNPTYWSGCKHTDNIYNIDVYGVFTTGVPRDIFELAKKIVLNGEVYYKHMYKNEYSKDIKSRTYWFQQQTAGWSRFLMTLNYLKDNPARETEQEFINNKYF